MFKALIDLVNLRMLADAGDLGVIPVLFGTDIVLSSSLCILDCAAVTSRHRLLAASFLRTPILGLETLAFSIL